MVFYPDMDTYMLGTLLAVLCVSRLPKFKLMMSPLKDVWGEWEVLLTVLAL